MVSNVTRTGDGEGRRSNESNCMPCHSIRISDNYISPTNSGNGP